MISSLDPQREFSLTPFSGGVCDFVHRLSLVSQEAVVLIHISTGCAD